MLCRMTFEITAVPKQPQSSFPALAPGHLISSLFPSFLLSFHLIISKMLAYFVITLYSYQCLTVPLM